MKKFLLLTFLLGFSVNVNASIYGKRTLDEIGKHKPSDLTHETYSIEVYKESVRGGFYWHEACDDLNIPNNAKQNAYRLFVIGKYSDDENCELTDVGVLRADWTEVENDVDAEECVDDIVFSYKGHMQIAHGIRKSTYNPTTFKCTRKVRAYCTKRMRYGKFDKKNCAIVASKVKNEKYIENVANEARNDARSFTKTTLEDFNETTQIDLTNILVNIKWDNFNLEHLK